MITQLYSAVADYSATFIITYFSRDVKLIDQQTSVFFSLPLSSYNVA